MTRRPRHFAMFTGMMTGALIEPVNVTEYERSDTIPSGTTLASFLEVLAADPHNPVEHSSVVDRDSARFVSVTPEPGDTLELVHFVGMAQGVGEMTRPTDSNERVKREVLADEDTLRPKVTSHVVVRMPRSETVVPSSRITGSLLA